MKIILILVIAALATLGAFGETLPYISSHPQSIVVAPGSNAVFTVASTNATAYQWRFNGLDIAGGTASSLVITSAQSTNVGYYMAVAKNQTGWTPSQLTYLSVVTPGQGGRVPFSNLGNSNSPATYQYPYSDFGGPPITNGTAQLVAGTQLDQMLPVGDPTFDTLAVMDGFFRSTGRRVPNVVPGELAWFRVDITYPLPFGGVFTQQSTTITQIAGAGGYSSTASNRILFPTFPEWPVPIITDFPCFPGERYPPPSRTLAPGESLQAAVCAIGFVGIRVQWRKDGVPIEGATNRVFVMTNFQAKDVGVYDSQAFQYSIGGATQGRAFYLGIQTTNGEGVLRSPRLRVSEFVCDLEGIANRRYLMQCSTNLQDWTDLQTLTATNGTASFTNFIGSDSQRFYRSVLLP